MENSWPETSEELVHVDRDRLDEEWFRQSDLVRTCGRALADAEFDLAEAKDRQERVEARIKDDIRRDPVKYNLGKVTEGSLEECLKLQRDHKIVCRKHRLAKLKVDRLKADMKALDHKKSALENAVVLHGRQYFSEPRERADMSEITREQLNHSRKAKARRGK